MNLHLITLITLGILAISQFNVLKCTPVSDSDSQHDQIQISPLNRIESQPEVDEDAISSDKHLLNSYIKHLFDEKSNNDDELRILAHNLKSALEYKNQYEDEQEEEQSEQDQDLDKRAANSYLRFGRNGPAYLRFGRAQAYLRFGKRAPNSYLRFGKRNPAYLRFGRK